MNEALCQRCKIKSISYICPDCQDNFCSLCDYCVHSSPYKNTHKRRPAAIKKKKDIRSSSNKKLNQNINNDIENENNQNNNIICESLNYSINNPGQISNSNYVSNVDLQIKQNKLPNDDNKFNINNEYFENNINIPNTISDISQDNNNQIKKYSNNNINTNKLYNESMGVTAKYVHEIKKVYEQEQENLLKKINQLTKELSQTKICNDIENNSNNKNNSGRNNKNNFSKKDNLFPNVSCNNDEIKSKDNEIIKLQKIIEEQKNQINEIKLKNNNLLNELEQKQFLINKLTNDVEFINNKILSIDSFNKNQIDELTNNHNNEKQKMIEEYEKHIKKITDVCENNIKNLVNDIKLKDNIIKKYKETMNNEDIQCNQIIEILKKKLAEKNIINERLVNENKLLKENLVEIEEQLKNENNIKKKIQNRKNKKKKNNSTNKNIYGRSQSAGKMKIKKK